MLAKFVSSSSSSCRAPTPLPRKRRLERKFPVNEHYCRPFREKDSASKVSGDLTSSCSKLSEPFGKAKGQKNVLLATCVLTTRCRRILQCGLLKKKCCYSLLEVVLTLGFALGPKYVLFLGAAQFWSGQPACLMC